MAFKKVGNGSFKYIKYAECKEGQVLAEGVYLGTREGTYGIQHQIRIDDKTNDITVLNKSGHLDFLLANHVSKGDFIQVVYAGTEEMTKGKYKGKEMHQFEVLVDQDRSNPSSVRDAPSAAAASTDDEDEDDDSDTESKPAPRKLGKAADVDEDDVDEDDDDVGDDDDEEEAPPAKAEAPPAAAKKKMSSEELMAKYGKKG